MTTRHKLLDYLLPGEDGSPDQVVVLSVKHHNDMVREIVSCLPIQGTGVLLEKSAGGTIIRAKRKGESVNDGGSFLPFEVISDGLTTDTKKPKILVIAGNILARAPRGDGEADQTQIAETGYTFDGAAHLNFPIWLDLKAGGIGFGSHSSLTVDEANSGRIYFVLLAKVTTTAESGSGDSFVASGVTGIDSWWRGDFEDIPVADLPEHDHSDSSKGGNKLNPSKDGSEFPSFKVDGGEYIFQIGDTSFLASSWEDG